MTDPIADARIDAQAASPERRVISPAEFLAGLDGIDELARELIMGLLATIPESILETFNSENAKKALPADALANLRERVRAAELSFRLADRSVQFANVSRETRLELLARDIEDASAAKDEAEARHDALCREFMALRFEATGGSR